MTTLFVSAHTFIKTHARPLEQALFSYYFENGEADSVLQALATFQNSDGGFGNGLEPDIQLSDSSVIVTTVALQHLRALNISAEHPLVKEAMAYLLTQFDEAAGAWPIIPPNIDDAPHAPWWQYNPDTRQHLANPSAEVLGYLYQYGDGTISQTLCDRVTQDVLTLLTKLGHEIEMHDLMCYLRLLEAPNLPQAVYDQLYSQLQQAVQAQVAQDPAAWAGYSLKPLDVVASPTSPFATELQTAVFTQLDYEAAKQQPDGSWPVPWSWGDLYPDVWPQAQQAWRGILTLKMLRSLQQYGRL